MTLAGIADSRIRWPQWLPHQSPSGAAQNANNGELVVALLTNGASEHGEPTLKRYFRERDRIRLQPANQAMKPIYVRPEDVQVQGKVIALIRRM